MIDNLMDRLGRERFVLVASARHDLTARWSARSGRHNQLVLNLDPLDRDATSVLLDLLAEGDLPREVEAVLLDRSGGNPFFLEELVALVSATGAAEMPPGAGHDHHDIGHLPDTLRGLVAARLDALDPEERRVLEDASVWGRSGKTAVLERMAASDRRPDPAPALERLVDKEILVVDGDHWSFRSDLVRDVAYSTLTKAARARAHHGIAFYLESHGPSPQDADEWYVDVIAHHYAHAAELVQELGSPQEARDHAHDVHDDVVERALVWIEEAAQRAKGAQVLPVSIRLCSQALALVGDEACERTVDFLVSRAQAYADSRRLDDARADLDRAEHLAADLDYARGIAGITFVRGQVAQHEGDLITSIELLGDAAELFAAEGDRASQAHALRNIGLTQIYRTEHREAEAAIGEALAIFRELGDRRGQAWSLQQMAWISFVEGKAGEADERLGLAGAMFDDLGDSGGGAWVLGLTAFVRFQQGAFEEARQLGDAILVEARQRGDRWAEGMMLVLGAGVRVWTGQPAAALPLAEEAAAVFRRINDRYGQAQALATLGRTLVMVGRTTDGFRALEAAPMSLGGTADDPLRMLVRGAEAATALQLGDARRAGVALGPIDLASLDPLFIGDADRLVVAGLQRLQSGAVEEAVELAEIACEPNEGVEASAYARSVLALALAALGEQSRVLGLAAEVEGLTRATYLDRLYAGMAVALVRARGGDDGAIGALASLVDAADATTDRVAQAVARVARAGGLARLDHPGAAAAAADADDHFADLGVDGAGWRRVVDLVLAAPPVEEAPGGEPAEAVEGSARAAPGARPTPA
jgi:tetratricopeptide (TPR) repeat protein